MPKTEGIVYVGEVAKKQLHICKLLTSVVSKLEQRSSLTTDKYLKSPYLTQYIFHFKSPSRCIIHFDVFLIFHTYTKSACTYLSIYHISHIRVFLTAA